MNWHHSSHVMRGQSSQACADCVRLSAYPRIHRLRKMDCRVKPGNDGGEVRYDSEKLKAVAS
jgi:hypothetical protein